MRFPAALLILMILVLGSLWFSYPVHVAKGAQPPQPTVSTVFIDPLSSGNASFTGGTTFTVRVMLNLQSGESINGFDVRLNYTSALLSPSPSGGVGPVKTSGNIFAGQAGSVLLYCVNGVEANSTSGDCTQDQLGQIHYSMVILGNLVSSSGLLFSVTFQVSNPGVGYFFIDTARLANPGQGQNPVAHFVQVVTMGAVFANVGVAAFFNFWPSNGPAALPGQTIWFDARGSFNSSSPGSQLAKYTWDFGDGTSPILTASSATPHAFPLAGKYHVHLNVTNNNPFERTVVVVPALGSLQLTVVDQGGGLIRGGVTVGLFNGSIPITVPFENRTLGFNGTLTFGGLSLGSYVLKASGAGLVGYSKVESITVAGWPTQDTVYLSRVSSPSDYGGIIFLGSLGAAVGIVGVGIVLKKRRAANQHRSRAVSRKWRQKQSG